MPPKLKQILKRVSRSFYLSLGILPKAIRPPMGIGYLLCRAADTIADTEALPYEDRLKTLREFKKLFDSFPLTKEKAKILLSLIPEDIPAPDDKKLLHNIDSIFGLFNALSRTDQALIQEVVLSVTLGMETDLLTFGESRETLKALKTERDLENYLLLIGGEPGRFWTNLCLEHIPSLRKKGSAEWLDIGVEFGKGLQMVNILRDLPKDLQNGRCYIPAESLAAHNLTPEDLLTEEKIETFLVLYHELIEETIKRLENGLRYLTPLPKTSFRLRAAVWWPLCIALKTLRRLRTSRQILNPNKVIKITRNNVYASIGMSLWTLFSNRLLRWEFEDLR